jgi:hypothetical protein
MEGFLHIEAADSMKKEGIFLDGRLVRLLASRSFREHVKKRGTASQ